MVMDMVPTLSQATQPKRCRSSASSYDDDQSDHVIDSWGRKSKRSKPTPPRDYESEEKCVAECLILLSLSHGGLCISSSSSAAGGSEEESNSAAKTQQAESSPATADADKEQESSPATVDAYQELHQGPLMLPPPAQVNSFKCNTCGKAFSSFRALGGHKTSHRAKPAAAAEGTNAAAGISPSEKRHECSICHMVFQTGIALGGHKRKHYQGQITRNAAKKATTDLPTHGAAAASAAATDVTPATSGSTSNVRRVVVLTLFGKRIPIEQ